MSIYYINHIIILTILTISLTMKAIENKLQQQAIELMNRAKVIEELKVSLSIFIDKYNELKKNTEKGRYR
jgi:hypothetical protein